MYIASNGLKTAVILQDYDPSSPRDPDYQDNLARMVCWHRRYNLGDKHNFSDVQEFAQALAKKHLRYRDIFTAVRDGHLSGFRLAEVSNATVNGREIDPYYRLEHRSGSPDDEVWVSTSWRCDKDLNFITSGGHDFDVLLDYFTTSDLMKLLDASNEIAMKPLYLYDHSGLALSTGSFFGRALHAEWDSGIVGFVYMSREDAMRELAMPADTLRIAMVFSEDQQEEIILRAMQGKANTSLSDHLKINGFLPVTDAAHIQNLYGATTTQDNPEGNPLIDPNSIAQGTLFKKGHTLYQLDGWLTDTSVQLHSIASFNPDLLPLTNETWKSRAAEVMDAEVEEYDAYLRGEVYGFRQFEGREEVDSCWGFNPGKEDICRLMRSEMFGWLEPGMEFTYEDGENFDIDEFFENNDFPELRAKILDEVKSFLTFESETSQIYPFVMPADELLADKDGILTQIVEDIYDSHEAWDTDRIYETIQTHAGISRTLQPKITAADLDPTRDYTADELLAIVGRKPSLADQISSASARHAEQVNSLKRENTPER